ncbi:MAG TPA: VOC family protein [Candidatus Eremiobacteraceae bacterium]|nr:VOC family protein [Candidatus Eremiobacteraceae bacterium]
MPLKLGTVGHFGIAVRDPGKSARWWVKTLNLKHRFSFPGGVVVGTDDVDVVLHKGAPRPDVIDHVSFHLKSMRELRAALAELKRKKVEIEDTGHEIGSEGAGSKNMGLWFHDPDGYRWELSVLAKTTRPKKPRKRG